MSNIRYFSYDVIGANFEYGVKEHPQKQMINLGFTLLYSVPEPIADCWIFKTSGGPSEVPGYLEELDKSYKFDFE